MKECTFCIFRTLNDTHSMYAPYDQVLHVLYSCSFFLLFSFSCIDCLVLKTESFWATATKVKVFLDMVSLHSSANSRTDKWKKERTIKFQICTKHTVCILFVHFQMIAFCQLMDLNVKELISNENVFKFNELTCWSCANQHSIQRWNWLKSCW